MQTQELKHCYGQAVAAPQAKVHKVDQCSQIQWDHLQDCLDYPYIV